MSNPTELLDLDRAPPSHYSNGPGNVPRLPDRVVDTLIDSAGVSRCAPGRTDITVRDQTAEVEQLVHDVCEELLARLPDNSRAKPEGEAPQAEPVGEVVLFGRECKEISWAKGKLPPVGAKLYTHPPAATLSPLCGAQLSIGFANNDQGVHVSVMQQHAGGAVTLLHQAKVPAGDSFTRFALAAHHAAAPGALDGYAWLPLEPTEAMLRAAFRLDLSYMPGQEAADREAIYRAMVGAAPAGPLTNEATSAHGTPEAPQTAAARDVLAERQRQVEQEGWTSAHDDAYVDGQLASAAVAYTQAYTPYLVPSSWPWAVEWFKAGDDRRNMVKAGALILAEIERLDRAAAPKVGA